MLPPTGLRRNAGRDWQGSARSPPLADSLPPPRATALFHDARLQPFLYQADHASVSDPMFHKLNQPTMLNFVEKGPDIQVQNPVHPLAHDPHPQRIQGIVLAAPRPESIAVAQKVLFPRFG